MYHMNYYISDLHILHKNVCKEGKNFDQRPFETMDEMMNFIQQQWNDYITDNDDVYILGDFCWKENEQSIAFVSSLKGKKHLIIGNHDRLKNEAYRSLFVEITPYKEVHEIIDGLKYFFILQHYPIMFWNHQHHLNNDIPINIHLYGHVHNSLEETIYQSFIQTLNQTYHYHCIAINVGCMMPYIHYQPKTARELLHNHQV